MFGPSKREHEYFNTHILRIDTLNTKKTHYDPMVLLYKFINSQIQVVSYSKKVVNWNIIIFYTYDLTL